MIRAVVVIVGLVGTSLASLKNSLVIFWMLGSDIAYVLIFPQIFCIILFKISNGYGAIMGCLVGLLLRLLSGQQILGIPAVIHFPGCSLEDGVYVQYAPVRTIAAMSAIGAILLFSYLASVIFSRNLLPDKWDVFNVKAAAVTEQNEDENLKRSTSHVESSQPMISTTF